MGSIIFWVVVVAAIVYGISLYNALVTSRNQFKNAFAQIDVQLERRYDLIPNLVETSKAYMKHEQETLTAVIDARNSAHQAKGAAAAHPDSGQAVGRLGQAEGMLAGAMGKFMALAEAYPDLKANQTMQQLMEELSSTENKIAFARQFFNDAVMSYNNTREQFPNNLLAGPFRFDEAQMLEISAAEKREAIKVKF